MVELIRRHWSYKVGVNVHHLEWCTKYRYNMFRQEKYKKLAEDILRETAKRWKMVIRELFIMPDHVHVSVECPPRISQSKALQLLKGNLSYQLFKQQPKFRLRYPKGHFFSPSASANSTGYTTVDVIDRYVRNQLDVHQTSLTSYAARSPAL